MSKQDYTPDTEEVRSRYFQGVSGYAAKLSSAGRLMAGWKPLRTVSGEEFDRWLNAERARIWEEGRKSAFSDIYGSEDQPTSNPYGGAA